MHPSKEIIGTKGNELSGRRIALCVCGSVSAVKSPEIARELMRKGAEVFPVMSAEAQRIVHPNLMQWATGNEVVTELTGKVEHVALAGKTATKADIVLIAPCTANTIGKIASGIDDTTVATLASTALGTGIPIMIAPGMHASLYEQPVVAGNIGALKKIGVEFIEPSIEEGKAKMAPVNEIVDAVIGKLHEKSLRGKKVLITAGATREFIDDVRFISNPSTGRMGLALVKEAWFRGADVLLIHGNLEVEIPRYVKAIKAVSTAEMQKAVFANAKNSDVVILAAAVSDFYPKRIKGKISSGKALNLKLERMQKISDSVKKVNKKAKLIIFKAESRASDAEMEKRALEKLRKANADLVVANDVSRKGAGFGSTTNEVLIIGREGMLRKEKDIKENIAKTIFELLAPSS